MANLDLIQSGESSAADRLSEFLRDVDELFQAILGADWLFFQEDLRQPITLAHSQAQDRVFAPSTALRPPTLISEEYHEELAREGLTGDELNAKLSGYVTARRTLARRGGLANFRRAWRWMKAILSSLGRAFPPAGAILEIADLIENGFKDVGDLERDRS